LFQLTQTDAILPTRAYTGDAGYDLYTTETTVIPPKTVVDVATGVAVAIPVGHYGRIVGRSSTHRKRGLSVVEGVIDAGYRGPLFSCVWNPSETESVTIEAGERVAQLIVTPVSQLDAYEVETLPNSDRGVRGFGSSGRGQLVR
jgi:dUTP pyrophosphatase